LGIEREIFDLILFLLAAVALSFFMSPPSANTDSLRKAIPHNSAVVLLFEVMVVIIGGTVQPRLESPLRGHFCLLVLTAG